MLFPNEGKNHSLIVFQWFVVFFHFFFFLFFFWLWKVAPAQQSKFTSAERIPGCRQRGQYQVSRKGLWGVQEAKHWAKGRCFLESGELSQPGPSQRRGAEQKGLPRHHDPLGIFQEAAWELAPVRSNVEGVWTFGSVLSSAHRACSVSRLLLNAHRLKPCFLTQE